MGDFISHASASLIDTVSQAGYLGVGFLMALDAINVPVPSELVLAFAGYLVATGQLTFVGAVASAWLAFSAGSALSYWVGYRGGRPFVTRFGKYFFVTKRDLELADRLFAKYGSAIAFFTRFVPVLRTFVSVPAGITRMHFGKFMFFTMLGSLVWSTLFIWLGSKFGENYHLIKEKFQGLDTVILAVIALAVVAWIVRFFWHRRRERLEEKVATALAKK